VAWNTQVYASEGAETRWVVAEMQVMLKIREEYPGERQPASELNLAPEELALHDAAALYADWPLAA
jgi:hypothetical protein